MEPESKKPRLETEEEKLVTTVESTENKLTSDNQEKTDTDKMDDDSQGQNSTKTDVNEKSSESCAEVKEKINGETDVGITEYVSDHKGFTAIIKQRFSDFLVNEINVDGEIVRLTNTGPPKCDEKEKVESSLIPEDIHLKLKLLESGEEKLVEWKIAVDDKGVRTEIHRVIRENYKALNSSTIDKDDDKYIKVVKGKDKRGRGYGERQSWYHPGDFCRFVLYKENKDTSDALDVLHKMLGLKSRGTFSFAGTKDKRAKTCQLVTGYRVEATELQRLNPRLINIAVGNFSYVNQGLKLGALKGNHFTVVLRNVTGSDDQLGAAMKSLANVGFINYFGMQRFGTTSVGTHAVGKVLLQQKFDKAIELILQPREGDNSCINAARQHWWKTRDARGALQKMEGRTCLDRHLLQGLAQRSSSDYVGALSKMPRNSRLMYVHAYQSYIWNLMVSSRIRRYGLKPVAGDFVLKREDEDEEADHDAADSSKQEVEELTEETLSSYTIHDIVMPTPGYEIQYPKNQLGDEYRELLKKDGLEKGLKNTVRDYSLPGNYRKIMAKPFNVKWETCSYDDPTVSLVLSDGEKLRGDVTLQPKLQEGKYKAAIVEFSLSSSTYATMALREILKCDTSANSMTQLNVT